MYVSPEAHSAFTGSPVEIGLSPGDKFTAFGGALTGTMLQVIEPTFVVQSWRSESFKEEDRDSTLMLKFSTKGGDGFIDMIHLDVPKHDYDGVSQGWQKYYWTPWNEYLKSLKE